MNSVKIFAGSSGEAFARRICSYLSLELGLSKVITFTEGNIYVKIEENVREKDVFLVQSIGLNPNDEFTEILFWMDAFKRASARRVTLIMPFFSYAQGDKKDEPRVSIRGRVCAECIELAGADRIVTMDLHSPQIQGFFKKPVDHLFALPILCEYIQSLNIEKPVIVAPDAGFAKEARQFGKYLGWPIALGDKERCDHSENAKILEIIGDVKGKNAVIVDDFSISGGTLIDLAKGLKERGVNKVYACLSHCLLNEIGIERLRLSPIELLITTDSINNPCHEGCDKVKIVSVAGLFAETIDRIGKGESVSPLFIKVPEKVFDHI